MTKRTRNKLGQFVSFTLMEPKPEIFFAKTTQAIFKLFWLCLCYLWFHLVELCY